MVNEIVKLKKPHACGNNSWKIIRQGADYKLKCTHCGRIIMLSSEEFKKRLNLKK